MRIAFVLMTLVVMVGVGVIGLHHPMLQRVRGVPVSDGLPPWGIMLLSSQRRSTWVERVVGNTPISHVGLLCRDAAGVAFLFHTTRASGATRQLFIPWVRRAVRRGGQVFVRALRGRVVGAELEQVLTQWHGVPYSFGFWRNVMPVPVPRAQKSPRDRQFCSQLVVSALQDMGVVAPWLETSSVLPSTFWNPTIHQLPWMPGFGVGPLRNLAEAKLLPPSTPHPFPTQEPPHRLPHPTCSSGS